MKQLQQHNQLEKLIRDKFFGDAIHPISWKAFVVDVDYDGTVFETKVPGAVRIRIPGLHDTIEDDNMLPIALPFWLKSGFRPSTPKIDDYIFIIFEYLEPIGQAYWTTLINPTSKVGDAPTKIRFVGEKKPIVEETIAIPGNTITKHILDDDTYYQDEFEKDLIVIHHTVSKGTPQNIIDYWNNDGIEVATAYVIGLNGEIYLTFKSDKMWAWHLKKGVSTEKRSIGIEMINVGPVAKVMTGYMNTYGNKFDGTNVEDVGSWRDYRYFIQYTDAQYKSLNDLLNFLCSTHNIPKQITPNFFSNEYANISFKGIIGHSSVRPDKTDPHLAFDLSKINLTIS